MPDVTKVFGVFRVIVLGTVILFSALVLIMAALVTNFTTTRFAGYFIFAAFAIAISALTLLTLPVMLALSISRKGAFPSMIVVELCYVGVLWILWLAVGATIGNIPWLNVCSSLGRYYPGYEATCMETQVMAAFSFLNWILLMVLNIFLLSLAIMQANRGNSTIWTSCVTDVNYSAGGGNFSAGSVEPKFANNGTPTIATPVAQYPQLVPTPQPMMNPQQPIQSPTLYQAYPPPQQQTGVPMSAQV